MPATERPPAEELLLEESDRRTQRNTPLLPAPSPVAEDARATLRVLTGVDAGRVVPIDGASLTIGRADDADMIVDEMGVSRHHARITRAPGGGFCVEDLGSTNGTFVGAARVDRALLNAGDMLQLGPELRLRFAIVDSVEETLFRRLYDSSMRDPLTHLFNRRYFLERTLAEIARVRRAGSDLAVLMIDVDSLKTVNDSFGHLAGDRALCTVAARIQRALRLEDVLARHGGDEFIVLTIGTGRDEAERLAERVRRAVASLQMSAAGRVVPITVSIGVALLTELAPSEDPVDALLALADARMYGAKSSGKNAVCMDTVAPPSSMQLAGDGSP